MLSGNHGHDSHAKKRERKGRLSFLRAFMTATLVLSLVGGGVALADDESVEGEFANSAITEPAAPAPEQPAENATAPASEEPADTDGESVDVEVPTESDQLSQPAISEDEEPAVDDATPPDRCRPERSRRGA